MDKVLLDTDVMLDFFFDRKPFSEETSRILSLCEKEELKGYIRHLRRAFAVGSIATCCDI